MAEHECPQGLSKLYEFIEQHQHCGELILAETDIVPDVVRLDCEGCNANVQVSK